MMSTRKLRRLDGRNPSTLSLPIVFFHPGGVHVRILKESVVTRRTRKQRIEDEKNNPKHEDTKAVKKEIRPSKIRYNMSSTKPGLVDKIRQGTYGLFRFLHFSYPNERKWEKIVIKIKKVKLKIKTPNPNKNPCTSLKEMFAWSLGTSFEVTEMEKLHLRGKSRSSSSDEEYCKEVASLLEISMEDLEDFELFDSTDEMFQSFRNNPSELSLRDISRIIALSKWQKEDMLSCAYYLSESHGLLLKSDIVDKHYMYLRQTENLDRSCYPDWWNFEDEDYKKSIFLKHIDVTLSFGTTIKDFKSKINKFDPDWNIIQISNTMRTFDRSLRKIERIETPALFVTSFFRLPKLKTRSPFVALIEKPTPQPGSLMRYGILDEFSELIDKNLLLNDGTFMQRKVYWSQRARHDECLLGILQGMEENWLFPWNFLFPGTIKSPVIQNKIYNALAVIKRTLDTTITQPQSTAMYKLIENFSFIPSNLQTNLAPLLAEILNVPNTGFAKVIKKIQSVGSEISIDEDRHPTILILDQEVDRLPWECLPCLEATTVTRAVSIASIESMVQITKTIHPQYPNLVDPMKCTYILNPDLTLKSVQDRLHSYFACRKTWHGIVARIPKIEEMRNCFEKQNVLLYCGHGSGEMYFPDHVMQKFVCRTVPLLMGCSSVEFEYLGELAYSKSIVNSYFAAGCSSVVGFLWEITDLDCDRVTGELVERWLSCPYGYQTIELYTNLGRLSKVGEINPCLPTALKEARAAANNFLTAAGMVNYGLPISTKIGAYD